jgi:hypothetical protein
MTESRNETWWRRAYLALGALLLVPLTFAQLPCPPDPGMDPNTVPFPMDPNFVFGKVLGWGWGRLPVVFDKSGSVCDPDGDDVTLELISWKYENPPGTIASPLMANADPNEILVAHDPNAQSYNVLFTPSQPGTYYAVLRVEDPYGAIDIGTIAFDVRQQNQPPVIGVCGGQ